MILCWKRSYCRTVPVQPVLDVVQYSVGQCAGQSPVDGDYTPEFENLNWRDHSDTDDAPKDADCPWPGLRDTWSEAVGTSAGDAKEQGCGHGTNVTSDDLVSDQDLHMDASFGWLEEELGVEL
jgi:hypothetical protein